MNTLIQTVTLCADPTVSTYGDGKSTVKFNGAVAKRYKKEGEADADFFQYVAFGATADFISKYFKKGSKMLMTGQVRNNNYKKEDGTMVYGTQILIDNVEFFGKKSDGEVSGGNTAGNAAPKNAAPANDPAPAANSAPAGSSSYDEFDDF